MITSSVCNFHCVEHLLHNLAVCLKQYVQTVGITAHTFSMLQRQTRASTDDYDGAMELFR